MLYMLPSVLTLSICAAYLNVLHPDNQQVREEAAELRYGHADWDPLGIGPVWGAGPTEVAV